MISWVKRKFDRYVRSLGYVKPNEIDHAKQILKLEKMIPHNEIKLERFAPPNKVYFYKGQAFADRPLARVLNALKETK